MTDPAGRDDCGTHIGLVEATIRFALDHEKIITT